MLQRDLEELTSRAFYHPAGGADEIQILLEADNLKVYSYKKFDRPTKLSGREMLALALGLRASAGEADTEASGEILDLAHRIEMELAVSSARGEDDLFGIDEGDDEGAAIRSLLKDAARSRTRCRLLYLKPNAPRPEERDVDPYSIVYGSGRWYVIGYCHLRKAIRAFRVDRLLKASALESGYDIPEEFEPTAYVSGGRVFRSESEGDVFVQYSAAVAPWVREHGPIEEMEDGRVAVRFTTADPGWVVRHVLSYGPEAEVVEPPDVRDMVSGAVSTLLQAQLEVGQQA